MRECRDSIFLTLVVASFLVFQPTLSWAAPSENLKPSEVKETIQDVSDPSLSESAFRITKEDQIIQFNFGIISGNLTESSEIESPLTMGFAFDWKDDDQNYKTFSARWLNNTELAWLEIGKKFMIFRENLHEPYYKLSLSNFMTPNDSLAAITRLDSYKGSISFGFLDLWTLGRILNVEVGVHWGVPGFAGHAHAGAQWSF